jgi:CRISPR system Cascade subunit CasD
VGESRHSAVHPSKSALLGLLGAALGITRDDDAGQAALVAGYRFGVKLVSVGTPLRDYHTVQSTEQQRKVVYRTRRHELADKSRVGTLLSSREYRCDSIAVVAVEALPGAPYDLPALADALRRPVFPLYLGRKSCPLAVPLQPRLVTGVTLQKALDDTAHVSLFALASGVAVREGDPPLPDWPHGADARGFGRAAPRYYWEPGMDAGMSPTLSVERHDQPLSRRRWQFGVRREAVFLSQGDA